MLGKAIKELKLPRDELVIMTKVGVECCVSTDSCLTRKIQVFFPVGKTVKNTAGQSPDDVGLVNQYGLSRKVSTC